MPDTSLTICLPKSRERALRWVCEFVFGQDLTRIKVEAGDADTIRITDGTKTITLASEFPVLSAERSTWAQQAPQEPLARLPAGDVMVLFGTPDIFFLLSRFEEIISPARDAHDRFASASSLGFREGYLNEPLADIYRDLLLSWIEALWPGWRTPDDAGGVAISCDVDEPFDRCLGSVRAFARTLGGDILKRCSAGLAVRRTLNFALHKWVGTRFDPCYTFDWYMDLCEANGLKATFYFIAGHSAGSIDGSYDIDEPRIIELLQKISRRGHMIAMHGSYNTFRDPEQLKRERAALGAALGKASLAQDVIENRQHYLRWDAACTPDYLFEAGFRVDASGGFADHPGFRYGTARAFRMWSWRTLGPIDLEQRPLIVMEGSLLSPLYLQMTYDQSIALTDQLQSRVMQYGGVYSLLWHNSELETAAKRGLFSRFVQSANGFAMPTGAIGGTGFDKI